MSTKNEYMLIFSSSDWYNHISHEEIKKIAEQAKAWFEGLVEKGLLKGGNGLAREGARIAARTGRILSDGPFAESKEAVGGYTIVETDSLEEAIAIAKSNPTIPYGTTVDVRPLFKSHDECPLFRRLRELEQEPAVAQV